MGGKAMTGIDEGPREKQVFAVYCKDDKLLRYYRREEVPQAGAEFDGRTADAVYADVLDEGAYSRIRRDYGRAIADIEIVDDGIGGLLLDKEMEYRMKADSEKRAPGSIRWRMLAASLGGLLLGLLVRAVLQCLR